MRCGRGVQYPFCIKRSPFARAEVVAPNWAFWSSASGALLADSAAGKLSAMVVAPALVDWLLDSDPALRWQVERDLAGAPQDLWGATVPGSPRKGSGHACLRYRIPTRRGQSGRRG